MDIESRLKNTKLIIKSILVSSSRSVTVKVLRRDYYEHSGEDIPYRAFGYNAVIPFLESMPDVLKLSGSDPDCTVIPVVNQNSVHIEQLIQKQRKVKPTGRARYFQQPRPNAILTVQSTREANSHSTSFISKKPFEKSVKETQSCEIKNYSDENNDYDTTKTIIFQGQLPISAEDHETSFGSIENQNEIINSNGEYAKYSSSVDEECKINFERGDIQDKNIGQSYQLNEFYNENKNDIDHSSYDIHNQSSHYYDSRGNNYSVYNEHRTNYHENVNRRTDQTGYYGYSKFSNDKLNAKQLCDNELRKKELLKSERSNKQTIYNEESSRSFQTTLKDQLKRLISTYNDGIWCGELSAAYKLKFKNDLDISETGYASLSQYCMSLTDIFQIVRYERDFMLYDIKYKINTIPIKKEESSTDSSSVSVRKIGEALPPLDPSWNMKSKPKHMSGVIISVDDIPRQWITDLSDEYIQVKIAQVYDPSIFWIHLNTTDCYDALTNLMDEIQCFYATRNSDYIIPDCLISEGLVCAGLILNEWHRGVIVQIIDDDNVKVFYFDYGSVEKTHKSYIRYLATEFKYLPQQAIRARLSSIKPYRSNHWSQRSREVFWHLILDKTLYAGSIEINEQKRLLNIVLIDTSAEEDLVINEYLCRKLLATGIVQKEKMNKKHTYLLIEHALVENGQVPSLTELKILLNTGYSVDAIYNECFDRLKELSDYKFHITDFDTKTDWAFEVLEKSQTNEESTFSFIDPVASSTKLENPVVETSANFEQSANYSKDNFFSSESQLVNINKSFCIDTNEKVSINSGNEIIKNNEPKQEFNTVPNKVKSPPPGFTKPMNTAEIKNLTEMYELYMNHQCGPAALGQSYYNKQYNSLFNYPFMPSQYLGSPMFYSPPYQYNIPYQSYSFPYVNQFVPVPNIAVTPIIDTSIGHEYLNLAMSQQCNFPKSPSPNLSEAKYVNTSLDSSKHDMDTQTDISHEIKKNHQTCDDSIYISSINSKSKEELSDSNILDEFNITNENEKDLRKREVEYNTSEIEKDLINKHNSDLHTTEIILNEPRDKNNFETGQTAPPFNLAEKIIKMNLENNPKIGKNFENLQLMANNEKKLSNKPKNKSYILERNVDNKQVHVLRIKNQLCMIMVEVLKFAKCDDLGKVLMIFQYQNLPCPSYEIDTTMHPGLEEELSQYRIEGLSANAKSINVINLIDIPYFLGCMYAKNDRVFSDLSNILKSESY